MRRLFFHEECIHEVSRRYREHEYTHTHISTGRNQYVPHFFKVGGIKRRGIELCQARHHVVKSGPAEAKASAKGTIEGESTRGGMPPLLRGVRGISPEKIFDLWLPLCAFLMHFGSVFSRLGLIWNRWHCISIIEHWHRTIYTVSGLRIAMHANSKRKIHTLPFDMFFDLELLAKYIEGIKTFFCRCCFFIHCWHSKRRCSFIHS